VTRFIQILFHEPLATENIQSGLRASSMFNINVAE
jgi:hypothetical protein